MSRRLSNPEYAWFLSEIDLDSLNIPSYGAVVQWGEQQVLCFKMPTGEWALSDVTSGIPYKDTTIPISDVIKNVPATETGYYATMLYAVPSETMGVITDAVAKAGDLATAAGQVGSDVIDKLSQPMRDLEALAWPIAVIGIIWLIMPYFRRGA